LLTRRSGAKACEGCDTFTMPEGCKRQVVSTQRKMWCDDEALSITRRLTNGGCEVQAPAGHPARV
jgi:hypothetical protein